MIIALIGDIHGNAPALETVLRDARERGARRIYNVGDIVGEAPFPNETIKLLLAYNVLSIRGNFDRNVFDFASRIDRIEARKHPARVAAVRFTDGVITTRRRRYLGQLPTQRRARVGGVKLLFVHGSPRKENERLVARTAKSKLAALATLTDADVIVCGHTHRPFVRRAAGKLFINTGSVGRPAGDPRACYVLAECAKRKIKPKIVRLRYPVDEVVAAVDRFRLPGALKDVFRRGRKLNDVGEK